MKKSPTKPCPPQNKPYLGRSFLKVSIVTIIVFWAVLYLPNLRTTPNWYGDETLTLQVGLSLTEGKLQNRAIVCTFFAPAYNYQPGYALLSGIAARLTNGDILGARFFAVLIGLMTALTGFFTLRKRYGYSCALTFSFLLLGYSQAIVHYRWIYPHAVVGLSLIGALAFIMRPPSEGNDWKAGAFLALGACSNLLAIHAVFASLLCRLKRPRSWLPIALPSTITFAFTIAYVYSQFGGWVLDDFVALKEMYSRYTNENASGIKVINNLFYFFVQDWTHLAILISIPFCLNKNSYKIVIAGIVVLLLLVKNRQNLPLFYYQALAIFPILVALLAVGSAQLIKRLRSSILRKKHFSFFEKFLLRFFPVSLAMMIGVINFPSVAKEALPVKIHPWVVHSSSDYEAAANWLNQRTTPEDIVIAHWNLAWLLKAKTADILMVTSWNGFSAGDFFRTPIPRERFLYSADLNQSVFFVVTELDEVWAFHEGQVKAFLSGSRLNEWPLVFQAGRVRIFKNPYKK